MSGPMKAHIHSVLGKIARLLPPTEVLDGYESPELVELIFQKAADFVPAGRWAEFEGRSTVLDFGGGFAQHYKCAVPVSPNVRWAVVDTPAVVRRAAALVTENLRFFDSVNAAVNWLGHPDLMHSDSALQYTPDPAQTLETLCAVGAREMLWKRIALSRTDQTEVEEQLTRLDENGPRVAKQSMTLSRKLVRFKRTSIPETVFLAKHAGYRLVARREDGFCFVR
jgi:hypothetical protein